MTVICPSVYIWIEWQTNSGSHKAPADNLPREVVRHRTRCDPDVDKTASTDAAVSNVTSNVPPAAFVDDPPSDHVSEWPSPKGKAARAAHNKILQTQTSVTSQPKEISREMATPPSEQPDTVAEAPTDSVAGGLWRQAFERFHNNATFADVTFSFRDTKETLHGKGV